MASVVGSLVVEAVADVLDVLVVSPWAVGSAAGVFELEDSFPDSSEAMVGLATFSVSMTIVVLLTVEGGRAAAAVPNPKDPGTTSFLETVPSKSAPVFPMAGTMLSVSMAVMLVSAAPSPALTVAVVMLLTSVLSSPVVSFPVSMFTVGVSSASIVASGVASSLSTAVAVSEEVSWAGRVLLPMVSSQALTWIECSLP